MVRFYKTYLGRLILGLLVLIETEKSVGKAGIATIVQRWTDPDVTKRMAVEGALDYYLNNYPEESPTNEEVLSGAFGQMGKRNKDEGDLLDIIVDALRLPFLNYISSDSIRMLRDAILTPSELSDVKKAFKANTKCTCGYEFRSGDVISPSISDETITLRCHACARPQWVRCDTCHERLPIGGKVLACLSKPVECGCTKAKAEVPQVASASGLTPAQMRILQRQAARAAQRAGVPTAPPRSFITQLRNSGIIAPSPLSDSDGDI